MSKENKQNLRESIKPEDIVFENQQPVDDKDMPRPETKLYTKYAKLTPLFMELIYKCVNTLPYKSVLTYNNGTETKSIKLIDLVRYIEQNQQKMPVTELNTVISYIADIDFQHARPLMEVVESKDGGQQKLWTIFQE